MATDGSLSHRTSEQTVNHVAQEVARSTAANGQERRKRKQSDRDTASPEPSASSSADPPNVKRRAEDTVIEPINSPRMQHPRLENIEAGQQQRQEAIHRFREPTKNPTTDQPDDTFRILTELPFYPSSPEHNDDEEARSESQVNIDTWIDTRLKTDNPPSLVQVVEALRCTSMDPHLADQVLKSLVAGKEIPRDTPGIWTAEDDKTIEGNDARGIERVLNKHGQESFNARWEYLSLARTAGLEEETEMDS